MQERPGAQSRNRQKDAQWERADLKSEVAKRKFDLQNATQKIEGLLQDLNLRKEVWIPISRRPLKGACKGRLLEISIGYTNEPDGNWALRLRALDKSGKLPIRYVLFRNCPPSLQARLVPWLRRLMREVISETQRIKSRLEQALTELREWTE